MQRLARWGALSAAEADRAVSLALEGDDPEAIEDMLSEWTR